MGQEHNDGALLVKSPQHQGRQGWAQGSISAASSAPAVPRWGSRSKAGPSKLILLCVCLPRLGRQLARGELQPASSREFAHKSQFVKLLIPTSLVMSAAFSLQGWLFLALWLSFVPGAAFEISYSRRGPANNDANRHESSESQRRTLR